jgi:Methylamine utilisation protein MauE
LALLVRVALAAVLGIAAAAKLRSPRAAAAALETFRVPAPIRVPAMVGLATIEGALAVAVGAGSDVAAYCAAGLLVLFAGVIAAALVGGRRGAPCACLGARGRVGAVAVARNLALAGGFAAVPSLPRGAPSGQEWLVVALVVAFGCILALAVAVLALAREIGLLRLRLGPEPALDVADEGPPIGTRVELTPRFLGDSQARLALAIFSSDGCRLCQALTPVIAAFRRDPGITVEVFDEARDAEVWRELGIPGSPFAVALDRGGAVRAKGTFNTYGQLESIVASAEQRLSEAGA